MYKEIKHYYNVIGSPYSARHRTNMTRTVFPGWPSKDGGINLGFLATL